jgi:sulfatase modifying factor 1
MCGNRRRARQGPRTERGGPRLARCRSWPPWVAALCACGLLVAHEGEAAAPATAPAPAIAASSGYAAIGGGAFESVLPAAGKGPTKVSVAPYALQRIPVTNAEFLEFVRRHPQWQRGHPPATLADAQYLNHWAGPLDPGAATLPRQPVTNVSWFAARAYCEDHGARLPDWKEWEFAAAADTRAADARRDPAWRQRILSWYAKPSSGPLAQVGASEPNFYGVSDLHGLVWEWVEDFNALFISPDNRDQGDPDVLKYCGSGSLSVEDRENYPVLMRLAMLSSLRGNSTTANTGFRCAEPARARYHAHVPLQTQDGRSFDFDAPSSHFRIVSMFYASCPMACPLAIAALGHIDRQLSAAQRSHLEVLMISFDPARDTAPVLQHVVESRHLDNKRWLLARSAPEDVRWLSARLDIPYRRLPDGNFNHASVFVLVDGTGREIARTSYTGAADPEFVAAVRRALSDPKPGS